MVCGLKGVIACVSTYCPTKDDWINAERIDKEEGRLDWAKPAERLEREVRAYMGWPGSFTTLNGIDFVVTEATTAVMDGTAGQPFKTGKQFGVYCSTGALIIGKLKPAGKQEMPAEAFLNVYKL